jgi:hypothetical protein
VVYRKPDSPIILDVHYGTLELERANPLIWELKYGKRGDVAGSPFHACKLTEPHPLQVRWWMW